MRLLILTCNTGEGHNSAAGAVEEIALARGAACEKVDALRFLSRGISKLVSEAHTKMYLKTPTFFRKAYDRLEDEDSMISSIPGAATKLLHTGAPRMRRYLMRHRPDAIFCTHPFAAITLSAVYEKHPDLKVPSLLLATDYTCSPTVADQGLDVCVPHKELVDEFLAAGLTPERIHVTGIPVKAVFREKNGKEAARRTLGVDENAINIVLMCGSMGCGPMEELALSLSRILPKNGLLTVCCGTNKKLFSSLSKAAPENVRVLGFTRDVPLWMDSADLFITKPGGLSVTEAANRGVPLLLMNIVGGCETPNFRLFLKNGYAAGVENPDDVVALAQELLASDQARQEMVERQARDFSLSSAEEIWKILSEQ